MDKNTAHNQYWNKKVNLLDILWIIWSHNIEFRDLGWLYCIIKYQKYQHGKRKKKTHTPKVVTGCSENTKQTRRDACQLCYQNLCPKVKAGYKNITDITRYSKIYSSAYEYLIYMLLTACLKPKGFNTTNLSNFNKSNDQLFLKNTGCINFKNWQATVLYSIQSSIVQWKILKHMGSDGCCRQCKKITKLSYIVNCRSVQIKH